VSTNRAGRFGKPHPVRPCANVEIAKVASKDFLYLAKGRMWLVAPNLPVIRINLEISECCDGTGVYASK
jgi:hypothetical protein